MRTQKISGFTLIEILLVLVIIGILIASAGRYMQQRAETMRTDRTTMQMQQILNAALAYYVSNGKWPAIRGASFPNDLSDLTSNGYLPANVLDSSNRFPTLFGGFYNITTSGSLFYVYTTIRSASTGRASAIGNSIAGSLPLGYTSISGGGTGTPPTPPAGVSCTTQSMCNVVGAVNIPGQNLANATAVNFAGIYQDGTCVPAPKCPVDSAGTPMTPQIFVSPTRVRGLNDTLDPLGSQLLNPVYSFSAFATPLAASPSPFGCDNNTPTACNAIPSTDPTGTSYWRVCLKIETAKGLVSSPANPTQPSGDGAGNQSYSIGSLMVFTRCAISNEPSGTTFQIVP